MDAAPKILLRHNSIGLLSSKITLVFLGRSSSGHAWVSIQVAKDFVAEIENPGYTATKLVLLKPTGVKSGRHKVARVKPFR